ncbi:MAG TPA: hypothetical protein O0X25_00995 [Methanocorpusculum sp.]|nr:hypothetical protein [Methanocorpusculum sp.]HJJ39863.1 hypothetical protein [Methanocorpusculum sp.]HJJ49184.1 hypothetical protein [Methanocorpusculum sp.]HJJ56842.1 hypothetical protein [Methanocorpusculum sp.]HJJ95014.1 hypothetical protein [Methanocorpusculum sp.]
MERKIGTHPAQKKPSFPIKNKSHNDRIREAAAPERTSLVVHEEEATARAFTIPLYKAKADFFRIGIPKEQFYRSYIPIAYNDVTVVGRIYRGDHATDYLECKFPEPIRGKFQYPAAFTFERKGENSYKLMPAKDKSEYPAKPRQQQKKPAEQKSSNNQKRHTFPVKNSHKK